MPIRRTRFEVTDRAMTHQTPKLSQTLSKYVPCALAIAKSGNTHRNRVTANSIVCARRLLRSNSEPGLISAVILFEILLCSRSGFHELAVLHLQHSIRNVEIVIVVGRRHDCSAFTLQLREKDFIKNEYGPLFQKRDDQRQSLLLPGREIGTLKSAILYAGHILESHGRQQI